MSSLSFLVRSYIGLWLANRVASSGSGDYCWFSHLRLGVEWGHMVLRILPSRSWHHETHLLQIVLEISFVSEIVIIILIRFIRF